MQEEKETLLIPPAFLKEEVYTVECIYCSCSLSKRGMKSFLVADENTELYSTDDVDKCTVGVTDDIYTTDKCSCLIQSMACLLCGNVVGYHVKRPCRPCLQAQNNGHYWMFYRASILPGSRLNSEGTARLVWGELPVFEKDCDLTVMKECER